MPRSDLQVARLAALETSLTHSNPSVGFASAVYVLAIAHLVAFPRDRAGALLRVCRFLGADPALVRAAPVAAAPAAAAPASAASVASAAAASSCSDASAAASSQASPSPSASASAASPCASEEKTCTSTAVAKKKDPEEKQQTQTQLPAKKEKEKEKQKEKDAPLHAHAHAIDYTRGGQVDSRVKQWFEEALTAKDCGFATQYVRRAEA